MPLMNPSKTLETKAKKSIKNPLWVALLVTAVIAAAAAWFMRAPLAPQLSGQTISGGAVSPALLAGKPYLVNFWATSCVTCVKEMPDLMAIHQEFSGKGYQTIAVAMSYDRPDYIERFVNDRGLPFLVIHDKDNAWATAFGDVTVTPTTFVVDAQGKMIKRYVGEPNFSELRKILAESLI
jgi:peroxiredoxin